VQFLDLNQVINDVLSDEIDECLNDFVYLDMIYMQS